MTGVGKMNLMHFVVQTAQGAVDLDIPIRQLVIAGYYTSEIGMTKEREYLPVPGSYDGAYPYSKVNKVFTA